jgi:hypothetical protein
MVLTRLSVLVSAAAVLGTVFIFAPLFSGAARAEIFSGDGESVDLSRALDFEGYVKTGSAEEIGGVRERMRSYRTEDFFKRGVAAIAKPVTLLFIGMMYCPDCKTAVPFVEAAAEINPLIETKYFVRNGTPGAKEFTAARTGRPNIPAIFAISDGVVAKSAYVETPAWVTMLLRRAKTNEEREAVWDDFHAGKYDEEVQRDILELIREAAGEKN